MKTIVAAVLIPLAGCALPAQDYSPPAAPPTAAMAPSLPFSPEQLEQLLAPIALYPDPLIAIMLPASTTPSDIVLAARFLQSGGLPGQAELQPWADSVRALAHYPQVVRWMDENLTWTSQLGNAFASQPDEVMSAIQRLRQRAEAAGTLVTTPEQQVMREADAIVIVPANPDVIYVPYYDPNLVYSPGRYYPGASVFSYSSGFTTGWWLSYGLDWPQRRVWSVNPRERERFWRDHQHEWYHAHRPVAPLNSPHVHVWQPPAERRRDSWYSRPSDNRNWTPPARGPNPGFNRDDNRAPRSGDWRHGGDRAAAPNVTPVAPPTPFGVPPSPGGSAPATAPAPRHPRTDWPQRPNDGYSRRNWPVPAPAGSASTTPVPGYQLPSTPSPTYQPPSQNQPSRHSDGSAPGGHRHGASPAPTPPPAPAPEPAAPASAPPASNPTPTTQSDGDRQDRPRHPPFIRPMR
jgi:hypothetical protein